MSEIRSANDLDRDPLDEVPDPAEAFLDTPVKTNDPKALRDKAVSDKSQALKDEQDLREILATQGGIRFIARLLSDICYIDETPFHPSNSTMCNIAGRRQVGMTVKTLIRDADFELWVRVDRQIESRRARPKTLAKSR